MEEIEKNFSVVLTDNAKIETDLQISSQKIDELRENLEKIYATMETMEPQQKLFFLDRVLVELLISSRIPEFYLNSVIQRVSELIKGVNNTPIEQSFAETREISYIG